MPSDLDVLVRFNARGLRELSAPLHSQLLQFFSVQQSAPAFFDALLLSDTIWLGLRPSFSLRKVDYVVLLEGDFRGLELSPTGDEWGPPQALAAGILRYDRPQAQRRSQLARMYALDSHRLLFASAAEVDAVGRVVEQGEANPREEPVARGLVSFVLRTQPWAQLLGERSSAVGPLLEGATSLRGSLSFSANGFNWTARLRFLEKERAASTAHASAVFFGAMAARWPEGPQVEVEAVGAEVVLRGFVSLERVTAWLNVR